MGCARANKPDEECKKEFNECSLEPINSENRYVQPIEKKRLRGRNRIFFLVPFLQVHKKWCQLLAAALQHPKPVTIDIK